MRTLRSAVTCCALVGLVALPACPSPPRARPDGVDVEQMSEPARADYALFAHRCSKCHSLARPLSSGIDDDDYWARYVERMRRMPGSGISHEDVPPILRFLHVFSLEQRRAREQKQGAPPSLPAPSAVAPGGT